DPGRIGLSLAPNGARLILRTTADRAKVTKRVNPHSFRHGRATHLLRIGVPEAQVKKLLGWVPSSVMLGRYSHLADEDAFDALKAAHGLKPRASREAGKLAQPTGEMVPAIPIADPERFADLRTAARLVDLIRENPELRSLLAGLAPKG